MFTPALPIEKVNAIQRLGMGIVDKIFITFHFPGKTVPVPRGSVLSYQLLWKVRTLCLLATNISSTFYSQMDNLVKHMVPSHTPL